MSNGSGGRIPPAGGGGGGGGGVVSGGGGKGRRIIIERQDGHEHGSTVTRDGRPYFSVSVEGAGCTLVNASAEDVIGYMRWWL